MDNKVIPAVGIDLGTTFSCVAAWNGQFIEVFPNLMGNRTTPSIVSFTDKEILVGEQAREQAVKNPLNTIHSIKRIIGRQFNDPDTQDDIKKWQFKVEEGRSNGNCLIKVTYQKKQKSYVPEQISAFVLKNLKASAEAALGGVVKDAVITVPAYFNDTQRQSTKDAGRIAGLNVLEIISEPTAAALAYGIDSKLESSQKVLVFDLGGGTLDVTILDIDDGIFDVYCTYGDSHLGGDDFTNALVDYCITQFEQVNKCTFDRTNARAVWRLRNACEKGKIKLSGQREVEIEVDSILLEKDLNVKVSQAKYEDICKGLFKRCLDCVEEALKTKNLDKKFIEEIVLVGGSSRMPKIKNMLSEYFGGKNINDKIDPDESIARGASIEASKLSHVQESGLEDIVLCDVCPQSYGIAAYKGAYATKMTMSKIILANTQIPISKTEEFVTRVDNQTEVDITIYQGNYEELDKDYRIGSFILKGLPPRPRGQVRIDVTFEIDINCIISVTAKEKANNNKQKITIINNKMNLKEQEIEAYKREASSFITSTSQDIDVFNLKNRKDKIQKLEGMFNKAENDSDRNYYAEMLVATLEESINDTIRSEISNITVYENFIREIRKTFYYYNFIYQCGFSDEDKLDKIYSNIKHYLDIVKNEKLDDLFDFLGIFKDNKKIFDQLVLQIVRFIFNEGLKLNDKKEYLASKKILQKCKTILGYYDIGFKVMTNAVSGEVRDEYNDLKESISFYLCRATAGILIKDADNILQKSLTESDTLDMGGIYLALDKYREAYKEIISSTEHSDVELEAICMANICKIQYKILKSKNISSIKEKVRSCMNIAETLHINLDSANWFKEAKEILQSIQEKEEKMDNAADENFKEKLISDNPEIFSKIEEHALKTNIEFIKFILKEHPYDGYKEINVEEEFKKKSRTFIRKLKGKYSPRYLKKETYEEKVKYTIFHVISCKLNDLFSNEDAETKTER